MERPKIPSGTFIVQMDNEELEETIDTYHQVDGRLVGTHQSIQQAIDEAQFISDPYEMGYKVYNDKYEVVKEGKTLKKVH